jgi:hypothetical protein
MGDLAIQLAASVRGFYRNDEIGCFDRNARKVPIKVQKWFVIILSLAFATSALVLLSIGIHFWRQATTFVLVNPETG